MIIVVNRADLNTNIDFDHLNKKRNHGIYLNPDRLNFGALKVLKDVVLDGGKGFRTHEHKNIEVVIIPIHGQIEHKDSLGNTDIVKANDAQIISAGTGIFHYVFNQSKNIPVRFLQIWLAPKTLNINPCYQKTSFGPLLKNNEFVKIIPFKDFKNNHGARFHILKMSHNNHYEYHIKEKTFGLYLHIINGGVLTEGITLSKGDGCGFSKLEMLRISAKKEAELLIIEVPMDY